MCLLILILSVLCTLWFGAIIIVGCAAQIAFLLEKGAGQQGRTEQAAQGRQVEPSTSSP